MIKRPRFFSSALGVVAIAGLIIGGVLVVESFYFGRIFLEKKQEHTDELVQQVKESIEALSEEILIHANSSLVGKADSLQNMQALQHHLAEVAVAMETLVVRDRSDSLDTVFERFSMLMGITALIFAGFGVFTGFQFKQGIGAARKEMNREQKKFNVKLENESKKISRQYEEFQQSLYDAIDRSMDMIWVFGNSLEKFIGLGVVKSETATKFLNDLYKIGFRLELRSADENERMSAVQNLWAQGDCEDLPELKRIWQNEEESQKMRELTWLAITNILKRCPHKDGHSDLFDQTNHQ